MSGKLKAWTEIKSFLHLKKYLFKTSEEASETDGGYTWDSDWGWVDVDMEDEDDNDGSCWLDESLSTISPTGDIMAFAKDKRLVILSKTFDESENGVAESMKIKYNGEPTHMYEDDVITSVICVPLHSSRQSNHGAPDWTCIVVGFASGFVRFYSDNGGEVMSQRFHNTPVIRFRLRTYEPPRNSGSCEQSEELTVLYGDVLVCVEGFSLYQSLRACRNQIARASAGNSGVTDTPPLSFRKWALKAQDTIVDHASVGLFTPNRFDHLVTASLLGGPYATVGSTPPTHCVYAAAGRRPFLGLYYAPEGGWQPLLTDVARLVANKVKSAFFSAAASWLGGGRSANPVENPDKIEPATSITVRFGLPDKRREVLSIQMAPDHRLAATVDTFGRVLLVDVIRGITLRMWKGYRDAQVGWLQQEEPRGSGKGQLRRVIFLVIYAPRRGILEVWAVEQGPRVAAFNVGRGGRLLAVDYNMLGLNPTAYQALERHKNHQPLFTLFFLDRKGLLSTLEVPFHLCLTDRSSHRAHDYHLLKQLRLALREASCVTEEEQLIETILSYVKQFRLIGFLEQAVERILNTKYLTVIVVEQVFKEILKQLEADEICRMSPFADKQRLILYGQNVISLQDTYTLIQNLSISDDEGAMAGIAGNRSIEQIIAPHLPEEWAERIERLTGVLSYAAAMGNRPKPAVKPQNGPGEQLSPIQFIGLFYTHFQHRKENEGFHCALTLSPNLDEKQIIKLGRYLFRSYLIGDASLDDVIERMRNSCIPREAFMTTLLAYFLSEERHEAALVDTTTAFLQSLLHLKTDEVTATAQDVRSLLDTVEKEVKASRKLGSPLLLTVCVVSVLRSEIQSRQKLAEVEAQELTTVLPHWLALCRRCEDTLTLQLLLEHVPVDEDPLPSPTDTCSLPSTTGSPIIFDGRPDLTASLNRLAEGGRGFVTELFAKWATRWRLTLADVQCLYFSLGDRDETEMDVDKEGETPTTQELFSLLFDHFPMALEMDSVLVNVAWEYIFLWSKDMAEVSLLATAVDCLRSLGPGGAMISHGVASMAWHMHLEKNVQCATYLVEKVGGKAPKDRLCRKETSMSTMCLRQFLHHAFEFMEIFKQANCDADVVPAFMMDESWRDNVDGRLSLVELAIDQPITNYGLLLHHSHLLFILDAILTYDIRGIKPYSLFDQRGINSFFKSLTSHPLLPGANVDTPVQKQRTLFLNKLIACAVREMKDNSESSTPKFFIDRIFNQIAEELGIELDACRRQYVIELYSYGLDDIAEEEITSVNDLEVLTSQLLLIVGQRCAHMIFPVNQQMNLKLLGLMPPVLETYFKTSNYEALSCQDSPIAKTHHLAQIVLRLMSDDHPELHRARLIADLVERFLNFGEDL